MQEYRREDDTRYATLTAILRARGFHSARPLAGGLVLSTLRWAAYNAPSGDLSVFAPEVIANAIEWDREPQELFSLLQGAGFIDANRRFVNLQAMFKANERMIHWMEQ